MKILNRDTYFDHIDKSKKNLCLNSAPSVESCARKLAAHEGHGDVDRRASILLLHHQLQST